MGICKVSTEMGLFEAPIQRGLCTHIYTYMDISAFFLQILRVLHKASIERGLWKAPTERELCTYRGASQSLSAEGVLYLDHVIDFTFMTGILTRCNTSHKVKITVHVVIWTHYAQSNKAREFAEHIYRGWFFMKYLKGPSWSPYIERLCKYHRYFTKLLFRGCFAKLQGPHEAHLQGGLHRAFQRRFCKAPRGFVHTFQSFLQIWGCFTKPL